MYEVVELHHHDATFDHVDPDKFEAYFATLDHDTQRELAEDLQNRFRSFGRISIEHLEQAALGVAADQQELFPAARDRRRIMGNTLLTREATIEKIQALLVIALKAPGVKEALEDSLGDN
jgi:hypothetical protein